jgi:hypothetical protein
MGSKLRSRVAPQVGLAVLALALAAGGCAHPVVARDGTLVVQQKGASGAAVMTSHGMEYRDQTDLPTRVVVKDANAPWRAPVGFILPANGRFTATSRPTLLSTPGLGIAMRPSDTRVPSWGGEVLVRIDLLSPAIPGTTRAPEQAVFVLDGAGDEMAPLAEAALRQLGGRDHVTVIDVRGARVVVPTMPASHRSLSSAAVVKRLAHPRPPTGDIAATLDQARAVVGATGGRLLVLFTDGESGKQLDAAATAALRALAQASVPVLVVATSPHSNFDALNALSAELSGTLVADDALDARLRTLVDDLPAPGPVLFGDVTLTFEGTPAPSHVLEASGGDVRWRLDAGELALGDVVAGEMRTEVVRVTVPAWVPGEKFSFGVTAHVIDPSRNGERRDFHAEIPCIYDSDIARIAASRHGDVIAYASALATMSRLDEAFVGPGVERAGGLRALAELHAGSMALLARDMHDPQIAEQAEILTALLRAEAP